MTSSAIGGFAFGDVGCNPYVRGRLSGIGRRTDPRISNQWDYPRLPVL
jgi:hypothetical protein